MKKYFLTAIAIAFVALALILSSVTLAQTPTPPPPVDATNAAAIAAANTTIQQINGQISPLTAKLNAARSARHLAEQKALTAAGLDDCAWTVSADGKTFVRQRGLPSNCH